MSFNKNEYHRLGRVFLASVVTAVIGFTAVVALGAGALNSNKVIDLFIGTNIVLSLLFFGALIVTAASLFSVVSVYPRFNELGHMKAADTEKRAYQPSTRLTSARQIEQAKSLDTFL